MVSIANPIALNVPLPPKGMFRPGSKAHRIAKVIIRLEAEGRPFAAPGQRADDPPLSKYHLHEVAAEVGASSKYVWAVRARMSAAGLVV